MHQLYSEIMKLRTILLMCALAVSATVPAKNFRWASQGDATTLDPHAQNETFTISIFSQVYETLVGYDKDVKLAPMLATSWRNTGPTTWVFQLRQNVKFHDGSPFTADDVVFSFERAKQPVSQYKLYSNQVGVARKIDDYTVEFKADVANPILPMTAATIYIMSKRWSEQNKVLKPQDFKSKEETFASRNAMGTGPYRLISYQPGVKTRFTRNPEWWGIKAGLYEGNVDTIDYYPIANASTRMAALRSGELDFVQDPSLQDVLTMSQDPTVKVWDGNEFRVVMIGFDQERDQLLYSSVKGKNPFKDRRVRLALYQAIDVNALKSQVMRGLSIPTGILGFAHRRPGGPSRE